jgi:hypothetical protein
MNTIILASATLAAMVIGLASVQAATVRHPAQGRGVTHASPPVYAPNGYYRGSDPDPFIRGQIRRDIPLGDQG